MMLHISSINRKAAQNMFSTFFNEDPFRESFLKTTQRHQWCVKHTKSNCFFMILFLMLLDKLSNMSRLLKRSGENMGNKAPSERRNDSVLACLLFF